MGSVVVVKDLVKTYNIPHIEKKLTALDHLSFSMEKGEILGIVGKSGSGKTTLLKILRGVESFDEGRVTVCGVTLTPKSPQSAYREVQNRTAIHLQRSFALWSECPLHNVMRKLKQVETGFDDLSYDKTTSDYWRFHDQAMNILDMVGLKERAYYYYNILSGGEKQRVLLARELARKPSLLLLDEPSTMSDPRNTEMAIESIKRIHEQGVETLYVSHMPQIHKTLADRLLWLDGGRFIDEGKSTDILGKFEAQMEPPIPLKPLPKRAGKRIDIKNVWKKYKVVTSGEVHKTLEMKNFNLDIKRGEIFGIVGPSSAGKTVLIRLFAGLEPADRGRVLHKLPNKWVDIARFGKAPALARQRISVLHQEFALIFHELVVNLFSYRLGVKSLDMINEAFKKAKSLSLTNMEVDILQRIADLPEIEATKKIEELGFPKDILSKLFPKFPTRQVEELSKPVLEMLSLPQAILHRHVYELSVGEQVRVAIGLHMTTRPEVLLLDEPFGDLDPITLRRVCNSIKTLNEQLGTTIIVVSHQLDSVEEVCHRAAFIDEGDLITVGATDKVCQVFVTSKGPSDSGDRTTSNLN